MGRHVSCTAQKVKACGLLVGRRGRKRHLERHSVYERIILKLILNKSDFMSGTGLIMPEIATSGSHF
jgi:hypothetical protein